MLVILGSARSDGETAKAIKYILEGTDHQYVDLLQYKIGEREYAGAYAQDDQFLSIAEQMQQHDKILFATPV